jgi:UDP-N-acetylglucosamine 2-epimerase (non-hydrolysing)
MKLVHIVGARPNFMKLAPLHRAFGQTQHQQFIVHTGQHYDASMSAIFFEQLSIPKPDVNLGIGSGSHTVQTAQAMMGMEEVFEQIQPDWVIVYGDVNSTLAAALVCAKNQIRIAHVEAGLRSFDRSMPEEINRMLTDRISSLLLTPSEDANQHLLDEGIEPFRIQLVGNIMIDSLVWSLKQLEKYPSQQAHTLLKERLGGQPYVLTTLHRPSNVDDPEKLRRLIGSLLEVSHQIQVLFPVHPRTRKQIDSHQLLEGQVSGLHLIDPVGYLDFLVLQQRAMLVITDSGGIQEETTYLQVPCLTVRKNTERPITVEMGSNKLVGEEFESLPQEVTQVLGRKGPKGNIPPLWDGKTADRIVKAIEVFE